VLLFLLVGRAPAILALTLAVLVYLAFIEVRKLPASRTAKLWWVLLVLLVHFPAYLALRFWADRKREATT
jgi:hypothetical protein